MVLKENLASYCSAGFRPISIQSAEHVQWLADQIEANKNFGTAYLSQSAGIPLGYDYDHVNTYQDLNDPDRSVIFEIFIFDVNA